MVPICWLRSMFVEPGYAKDVGRYSKEEIIMIKRKARHIKQEEITIKKYLAVDPSSFKLPFQPVPEYEEKYS